MSNIIQNQAEDFFNKHQEVFYPPTEFNCYEIINEDKENLIDISALLSNNLADMSKINFENKYEFVDSLIELGYITNDFEQEYNLTEMVSEINRLIDILKYDIKLSVQDILCQDIEITKYARQHFEYLTYHDLNECAKIVEKQGYELFQVFLDCGGLTMAILPQNKINELVKYFD